MIKNIAKHWEKILIVLLFIGLCFLSFRSCVHEQRAESARVEYQNEVAQLSKVLRENNDTWSRLAQERSDNLQRMEEILPELAEIIRQRDEQIMALARATASIRPIVVRITEENGASQSEQPGETPEAPGRQRVDFDTTHQEFVRIHGYTLTNPAEANVGVEIVRPVNFTVATTQAEDLSWRTYIQSDFPGLTIGEIDSQVTPIVRRRRWEQDIEVGVFGAAAVTGNAGIFGGNIGYDFGAITVGVDVGGVTYPGATDFMVGGRITFAPFDM